MGQLSEVVLDSKGRVLIPEKIRKKAGISAGSKVRVTVSDNTVMITKSVTPEEFIRDTEGIIKSGSPVKVANPLKLKEIWTKN